MTDRAIPLGELAIANQTGEAPEASDIRALTAGQKSVSAAAVLVSKEGQTPGAQAIARIGSQPRGFGLFAATALAGQAGEGPLTTFVRRFAASGPETTEVAPFPVQPPFGPPAGGMALSIVAPGVGAATAVKIDGVACTDLVSVSPGEVTCTSPALAATAGVPYDVEVDTPDGPIVFASSFVVTPIQAYYNPTIAGHLWQDTSGTVPATVGDVCQREDDLGPAGNHKVARTTGSGVVVEATNVTTLRYAAASSMQTTSTITWSPLTVVQFSDELLSEQAAEFPTLWTDGTTDNSGVYGLGAGPGAVTAVNAGLEVTRFVTNKEYGPSPFDDTPHVVAQTLNGTNASNQLYIDKVLQTPTTNEPTDDPGTADYLLVTGDPAGRLGAGELFGLVGCELYAGSVLSLAELSLVTDFFRSEHRGSLRARDKTPSRRRFFVKRHE